MSGQLRKLEMEPHDVDNKSMNDVVALPEAPVAKLVYRSIIVVGVAWMYYLEFTTIGAWVVVGAWQSLWAGPSVIGVAVLAAALLWFVIVLLLTAGLMLVAARAFFQIGPAPSIWRVFVIVCFILASMWVSDPIASSIAPPSAVPAIPAPSEPSVPVTDDYGHLVV